MKNKNIVHHCVTKCNCVLNCKFKKRAQQKIREQLKQCSKKKDFVWSVSHVNSFCFFLFFPINQPLILKIPIF